MFSNLYITIRANDVLDDSIIDPISFILIDWGVDDRLIDWDIYPNRAKIEIDTKDDNYCHYDITYQGLQNIMELCYEYEFVMTLIDNDDNNETYTTYFSHHNTTNFETEVSELII